MTLRIPISVFARDSDLFLLSCRWKAWQIAQMGEHEYHGLPRREGGRGRFFTAAQKGCNFPENPRPTMCAAADHRLLIYARLFKYELRFARW